MPVVINYKTEHEHHQDIKLEDDNTLVVTCQEINGSRNTELFVLMHNTTGQTIDHLIYALEQMKTFVPPK